MSSVLSPQQFPFFSIVLPTYNRAALLPRAVESVLRQNDADWELVIVDDGSTDSTAEFLAHAQARDARIRALAHSHRGLARTRGAGIAAARGRFVTFLDSDDEYAPNHLQSRRAFLTAHPAVEFLHGGVTIIGDPFVADKFDPSARIHISQCVVGGTFVMRRELAARLGGWPVVDYGDDNAFYQLVANSGAATAIIDAPTYVYHRGEPDSLCAIVERGGIDAVRRFQMDDA